MEYVLGIIAMELFGITLDQIRRDTTRNRDAYLNALNKAIDDAANELNISRDQAIQRIANKETEILTLIRDGNRNRNRVINEDQKRISKERQKIDENYKKGLSNINRARQKYNDRSNNIVSDEIYRNIQHFVNSGINDDVPTPDKIVKGEFK